MARGSRARGSRGKKAFALTTSLLLVMWPIWLMAPQAQAASCLGVGAKAYVNAPPIGTKIGWFTGHESVCTNGTTITSSSATSDGDTTAFGSAAWWNIHYGSPYLVSQQGGSLGTFGHATWRFDGFFRMCIVKVTPICGPEYDFWLRMTVTMYPWYYKVPPGGFRFDGRVWKATFVDYCDPSGIKCTWA